jgi:hypothetical protein
MPNRKIQELPDVSDFSTSSILHTKERSDNSDRKVTVQSILNLVNIPEQDLVPPENENIVPADDRIVYSDDSDSGNLKSVSFAAFEALLGVPTVSGNMLGGYYKIGDLEIRWGEVVNNTNNPTIYNFTVPFTSQCLSCIVQSREPNAGKPINMTAFTSTGFTLDRDFLSGSASIACNYIAIGR